MCRGSIPTSWYNSCCYRSHTDCKTLDSDLIGAHVHIQHGSASKTIIATHTHASVNIVQIGDPILIVTVSELFNFLVSYIFDKLYHRANLPLSFRPIACFA